jgi:hypothetical protein
MRRASTRGRVETGGWWSVWPDEAERERRRGPDLLDGALVARSLAVVRVAIGVTALAAPQVIAGPWIGVEAQLPNARLLARAMGMRDLALGAGALLALSRGRGEAARDWVWLGAASDAMDATLTAVAFHRLPRLGRWGVVGSAGGAALVGLWAASRM